MRIHFRPAGVAVAVFAAAVALSPLSLRAAHAVDEAPTTDPPLSDVSSSPASVTPPATREVLAEGRAAIGTGGLTAARKAAVAEALRSAVEKTTGVYVSAHTLTHNYETVRDQVITHADGFATPEAVVSEFDGTQEVRVTVRALVSLRPLAQELKALNLMRAWRVHVVVNKNDDGTTEAIGTALEKSLADAGLMVVSSDDEADIVVRAWRRFEVVATRRDRLPDGHPTLLYTLRGVLTLRATLGDTGEVVAALTDNGTVVGVAGAATRTDAITEAASKLTPRLTDALVLLPARATQPVQLLVGKIGSAARAGRFEDALNTLSGVTLVTQRRYEDGNAIYELQVVSDIHSELARDLEENAALKPFHLSVLSDTLVKIVAATNGVAPVFKSIPPTLSDSVAVVATAKHSYASADTSGSAKTTVNPIDGATMVWIPAGPFTMGDDDPEIRDVSTRTHNNPRHTVFLAGYYISKNLVTVGQYRRFCAATGHTMPAPPPWGWHDDHPMVSVTWDDARAYCAWADVRLPTEAEWEKAARGTTGRRYPWGNDFDPARLRLTPAGVGDTRDADGTDPVGAHPDGASPYGALDMAGNVWEWCADWYEASYITMVGTTGGRDASPVTLSDGRIFRGGQSVAHRRVVRGGSWSDASPTKFRSAYRGKSDPNGHTDNLGFRTVSEPWGRG